MRIKEIELVGFKSFVDKTRFTFEEGISGIVGPNGCGKSNIVDAIRWVMGEMSAKSLRGSEMQDVIFNGSELRKPMGMAQVSIVFSCEDGVFPTGYEGMTEIQVTRRLFRSGESEYMINRRPCRLKDVVDVFLDTGVGSRAYSVIEQGQIAKVISAKPLERRVLIEEAAGISKYRVKREEALRKIEATQTNLARVNDVIFEIKRSVASLQRQAAKAQRYHELKNELKELDLELAAREQVLLARQAQQTQETIVRLGDLKLSAASKLEAEDARLAALRLEVLEHEKAIALAAEKVASLRGGVREDETRRDLLTRDIDHLESQVDLWTEEVDAARERIAALEADAALAAQEIETLDAKAKTAEAALAAHQQALRDAQTRRQELDKTAEAARHELLRLAGRQASLDRAVQSHDQDLASQRAQQTANEARQTEVDAATTTSAAEGETLRTRLAALQEERTKAEGELADKKNRLANLRVDAESRREKFHSARDAYDKTRVRLESLEEMQRNLEGYQYGVRKIMEAARAQNSALNGSSESILGVLAEKIDVDEEYETALEAVLGERLQAVVVADQDAGAVASDFLKSEKAGRGWFVPQQPRRVATSEPPERTIGRTLGRLSSLVRVDPEYREAAEALIDNVLVVEDLATAVSLHKENGYIGAFVTLDGEVVDNSGTITGGQMDAAAAGLLQKKREIAELTVQAAALEEVFKKAEGEFFAHEGMVSRLQDVVARLQKLLDDNRIAMSETSGELRRATHEFERLRAEKSALVAQAQDLAAKLAERERRHTEEQRELDEINKALHAARHAADEKTAAQIALASEIDGRQKSVAEAMLLVNNLRQEQRNAAARRDSRLHSKDEAATLVAKRCEQIQQARETQEKHRAAIGVITQGLIEKIQTLEAAEGEAVGVREGVDEQIALVDRAEADLKLLRRELDGYEREIHSAELTAQQLDLKREHLAERMREKYQLELADLPPASDEAEMDTEALRTRAQEIGARIAQMGEVNPNAVEEYAEQKQRCDHYETQKADLEGAIAELKAAIAKINKTSKERFIETFELVSHKFSEVMPVLFGGGNAKLLLTEPDDPLESGIEIVIRPPGKKLTNVNLLSGGEKALASIGLIFSIFLVKPSPFCLLDEVDAPLDDANIFRFNELVEQMAAHSQILLITHNKSTMEVADCLYGVTMQEKGVSRLVSVKLLQEEQPAS